jgi:hypothetical protein
MVIKASTWHKETFGMYDYEEPPEEYQKLNIINSFHVYRSESEDACYISNRISNSDTLILNVLHKDGNFYIGTNSEIKNNYYNNAVWRVLKDYPLKTR